MDRHVGFKSCLSGSIVRIGNRLTGRISKVCSINQEQSWRYGDQTIVLYDNNEKILTKKTK